MKKHYTTIKLAEMALGFSFNFEYDGARALFNRTFFPLSVRSRRNRRSGTPLSVLLQRKHREALVQLGRYLAEDLYGEVKK